ncbi:ABC transporter ATP-binding protein [Chromobacterium amazonense]|uniref:Sn-glycerol-3-phosphate ABC transporter ATP-binding protein UgpC n=1 Tax=Chromobacterium amazonense TaxID=1382803 RepID=A0ABU8V683_9NEIS|nr:sn-glycerol-3-phosphate ABC transporter ATP-binding protein UgpC [Chromobacterium amazonense]MBM2885814.1 sn-glycerol-3-phosphate ABC transporter ATP-binding protein UgpC [Chromobacterium amazonense]MDE1713833.1 sn-glycerol-3-phosphate ABC transporter ATP-binding protein UgpC [Chromobacterium amazonense]MDQ4539467.1 sn-glycerol-3-phosphate ABC transporter ATP-binding protein UgpC [Chromobacterium amazonense]
MSRLSLKHIRKVYDDGNAVIHDVSLDICDGEFMVFVGPSGCGKSTMMRMIAGLEDITAGELWIDDKLANDIEPAKRGLAMVFQSYALYPHMTVRENMAFSLKLAGKSKAEIDAAVHRAALTLQIEHLLDRKPKALSGGQRQRVAIGRAIVRKPGVFLFDEPLSNLDAALRVQMRIELARLHQELGSTMIYVTHDQVEAMTLGHRIAVFNAGRIEQVGTPLELYNRPANRFVAGFLGSPKMNFIPARALQHAPDGLPLRLPGDYRLKLPVAETVQGELTLGVRAEHLRFAETGIPVTVQLVEHLGDQQIVYLRHEGAEEPIALKLNGHEPEPAPGSLRFVQPDPRHCHLFTPEGVALTLVSPTCATREEEDVSAAS